MGPLSLIVDILAGWGLLSVIFVVVMVLQYRKWKKEFDRGFDGVLEEVNAILKDNGRKNPYRED